MNLPLLYRTIRHLRPVQVANRLGRRLPVRPRAVLPALRPRAHAFVPFTGFKPTPLRTASRLRDYTLHYHGGVTPQEAERWIDAHPPGSRPAWEPYPLSLRIVNWIKRLHSPSPRVLASLAAQGDYLSRTVEYHLLANHLFANAKALVFAGAYFDSPGWLRHGLGILAREILEQVLSDGGHFERSPMYHSLIAEDLLDLVNLGRAYPGLIPDWSDTAARMLGWLERMCHPDGGIAFFNDAALDNAPPLSLLSEYAARLAVAPTAVALSESGYIRIENAETVVLFDAAPVGPCYQPGHAHADTLSFELSHRGRRILVNSGTSTYQDSAERARQRGTAAHNTVRIDGRDSSEVWSAFRVGRRARPFDVRSGAAFAEAAHDGYRPVIHRRGIEFADRLTVTDSIEGSGTHQVEVFFHLHPGIDPSRIHLDSALARTVEATTYHPRFDCAVPNQTVTGRATVRLPATFTSLCLLTSAF